MTPSQNPERGLFEAPGERPTAERAPLAERMRPASLEEFVGQRHLVGEGRFLRRLLEADRLPSLVLWGPPGSGKTTLARLLAGMTQAAFVQLSAVSSGVKDLRRAVAEADELWRAEGRRTLLFIDEIHRFNKSQQDAILPHVEDGTVTLVGATTENPSFEVNAPLLSRSRVLTLQALEPADVRELLSRALADEERGLGRLGLVAEEGVLDLLAESAGGDARRALGVLEAAVASLPPEGEPRLTRAGVEDALQGRVLAHDKAGDAHFDVISAFIKSVRGSDVDASLFYLARMIEAGEDPLFIVRRLVILAAEDVGLADPHALVVATACQQAVHFVGLPEGHLPMAECTIYLAAAPKSNSALTSYARAREAVARNMDAAVPLHLRNAPTGLQKSLGHGRGYRYPHDDQGHQRYLPDGVPGGFYRPGAEGFELRIRQWLEQHGEDDG